MKINILNLDVLTYVKDRVGHDVRYTTATGEIFDELVWKPSVTFVKGLSKTIYWYLLSKTWLERVISGNYEEYFHEQYKL